MNVAATRTGLSYEQALAELGAGRSVRRDCWCTSLSIVDGVIAWNISDAVARSCSMSGRNADKTYTPHPTDLKAIDWLVVELDLNPRSRQVAA